MICKLRNFYNDDSFNTYQVPERDSAMYLFTLLVFCFNSAEKFNMPVGKAGFNKSIRKKLTSFKRSVKNKDIEFIHSDFKVIKELDLHKNDFVIYMDPLYLIKNACF